MSLTYDIRKLYADGKPALFWRNRIDPFVVGSMTSAHSGKIAIVRASTSLLMGKPMIVDFRIARKAHLDTWTNLALSDPFSTTSLADYFVTGYKVIFAVERPIVYQNEIINDYDLDHKIFSPTDPDYRGGFDLFKGTLNLIITGT